MIILAPTIQHTGSYFLVKHLLADFKQLGLKDEVVDNSVIFDHMLPSKFDRWCETINDVANSGFDYFFITPIREPYKIFISWMLRGRDFAELMDQVEQFMLWSETVYFLCLPIDHTNRQDYLDTINKRTGLNLKTTWPIIHSQKDSFNCKIEELKPYQRSYEKFYEIIRPITGPIYGEN